MSLAIHNSKFSFLCDRQLTMGSKKQLSRVQIKISYDIAVVNYLLNDIVTSAASVFRLLYSADRTLSTDC